MKVTAIILVALGGSAMARTHHNCGCTVRGKYHVDLSEATCKLWGATQVNTEFDKYSCVDKGVGRGIDGQPWENTCKLAWEVNFGGVRSDAWGKCWH